MRQEARHADRPGTGSTDDSRSQRVGPPPADRLLGVVAGRSLGRQFGWLWAAYAVSTFGTWLAFDAFPLIAILVLHAGPAEVSAAGRGRAGGGRGGGGAARPVGGVPPQAAGDGRDGPDPVRGAAERPGRVRARLAQLRPAAGRVGRRRRGRHRLQGGQRRLPEGARAGRRTCSSRTGGFESTTWTATALGPPLGGAAIGLLGPVTTVRGQRGQLPALGARDPRDRRQRAAPGAARRRTAARRRPARRAGATS